MSSALIATLPSTVNDALDEIEDASKFVQRDEVLMREAGPFGVFSVEDSIAQGNYNAARPDQLTRTCTEKTPNTIPPVLENNGLGPLLEGRTFDLPNYPDNFNIGFNDPGIFEDFFSSPLDTLQWGDLFTWDFDPPHEPPGILPNLVVSAPEVEASPSWQMGDSGSWPDTGDREHALDLKSDSLASPKLDMDVDVPLLLRHFDEKVIDQIGSLPVNEKSPWRILNYSSAIVTFAQLTALKVNKHTIKHACLSNFYALIAVSAFHLSLNPKEFPKLPHSHHHWASVSDLTYNAAKYHLSASLMGESKAPTKAKYKVQLMAIAAILTTSVSFITLP